MLAQSPREEARWALFAVESAGCSFRPDAASWVSLLRSVATRPTSHLPQSRS